MYVYKICVISVHYIYPGQFKTPANVHIEKHIHYKLIIKTKSYDLQLIG